MKTIATLCDEDAMRAIAAIKAELDRLGKKGVIAVVDAHGETLALLRMHGAALSSINVATNKAFTAARLRRPSAEVGKRVRHPENGIDISYYGDPATSASAAPSRSSSMARWSARSRSAA